MKIALLKILVTLICCVFLFNQIFVVDFARKTGGISYYRQVHSAQDFKYWSYEDGTALCRSSADFSVFDKYTFKKTNIVYLSGVDLTSCKDSIKTVAGELHKRGLAFAINIENATDYSVLFKENYSGINADYFKNKFKDFDFINEWIDYLIFDRAMEYLSYTERRIVQAELRKVFNHPFLGFRFPNNISDKDGKHPQRTDKEYSEFLPLDDDGDFIITSIPVPLFRRTLVFIEDESTSAVNVNGMFLK